MCLKPSQTQKELRRRGNYCGVCDRAVQPLPYQTEVLKCAVCSKSVSVSLPIKFFNSYLIVIWISCPVVVPVVSRQTEYD